VAAQPQYILREFDYEHPILDYGAAQAQKRLPAIQGKDRVWFCGAWTGYGFHEDGLKSALRVVREFGVKPPWDAVYE
jgi:predicted NAD/FAD-binding protein